MVRIGKCIECGQEGIDIHAFKKCYHCYRKNYKPPIVICKKCGQSKPHRSHGMCDNCAQKEFYYEQIKGCNVRKYHNIDYKLWKKVTQKCIICGFDKIVELHHIDLNHNNNSENNFIGLCPNHHKMLHDMRYSDETKAELRKKLEQKA